MPWKEKPVLSKRAAARFAAVQALYQIDLSGAPAAEVAQEFLNHRLPELLEPLGPDVQSPDVDRGFFERLVKGVAEHRADLDRALAAALVQGWTLERCGFLLRACLRAAAFELAYCPDVPVKVAINEYVELAKLFLPDSEPAFVNAILDRLGPKLRSPEAVL
jgi:N utilization substance protein B